MSGGQQITSGQGSVAIGGTEQAVVGEESTAASGSTEQGLIVRLRSRKVSGGAASNVLVGQNTTASVGVLLSSAERIAAGIPATFAQGTFGKSRTRALTGSASTVSAGTMQAVGGDSSAFSSDDWISRSTASGVFRALRFDADENVANFRFSQDAGGLDLNPAPGTKGSYVRRNPTEGILGDGALEIEQIANDNLNSYLHLPFDSSKATWQFNETGFNRGPTEGFFVQLRFKSDSAGVNGGGSGGRKAFSVTRLSVSYTFQEIVAQDINYSRIYRMYQGRGLDPDGIVRDYQELYTRVGGTDFNFQTGSEFAEAGGPGYCSYSALQGGSTTDCWMLDNNVWTTYDWYVKPATNQNANGELIVWAWKPGMADRVKILHRTNLWMQYDADKPHGFNALICWIYETDRNLNPIGSGMKQWYDQIVLSTQPIPLPVDTVPSWYSSQPIGEWKALTGGPADTLADVDPCPGGGCSYTSVQGIAAVTDSWCGAAASPDSLISAAQGGHSDYAGNSLFQFEFMEESPRWYRRIDPSTSVQATRAYYDDGKPSSRHGYHHDCYITDRGTNGGRYFSALAMATYDPSGNSNFPDATTWVNGSSAYEARDTFPDYPGDVAYETFVAYDPVEHKVWAQDGWAGSSLWRLRSLDVATKTWSVYGSWGSGFSAGYMASFIDPVRRLLVGVAHGSSTLIVRDLAFPFTAGKQITVSGLNASGAVYEPVSGTWVFWNGGKTLKVVTPPSNYRTGDGSITNSLNDSASYTVGLTLSPSGGATPSAANSNGTYGRFAYIARPRCFCVVNQHNEPMYVYKLPPEGVEAVAPSELLWSQSSTWGGSPPSAGQDFTVPAGEIIYDLSTPVAYGNVTVEAGTTLRFSPSKSTSFQAKSLTNMGVGANIIIGDADIGVALDPQFTCRIEVNGAYVASEYTERAADGGLDKTGNARTIMTMGGGYIIAKGTRPSVLSARLNANAANGATTVTTSVATGWKAGDTIAVGTTDFYGEQQVDVLTLASDAVGTSLTFTTGLTSARWGSLQYPVDTPTAGVNGGVSLTQGPFVTKKAHADVPTVIDERAMLINLTCNVIFQAPNDSAWTTNGLGIATMCMDEFSAHRLEGVQFLRGGQQRVIAQYPFHLHMQSYVQATGATRSDTTSYAKKCVVWQSKNRSFTIHGTNGSVVDDNMAVDVLGHSFFLEDGSERRNFLRRNFTMKVRGGAIKSHDVESSMASLGQFGPTGYWITNPDNTVEDNFACDCAGPGAWGTFGNNCMGLSAQVPIHPRGMNVLSIKGFDCIGNKSVGFMVAFGVSSEAGSLATDKYSPTDTGNPASGAIPGAPAGNELRPLFSDMRLFKNRLGAYFNNTHIPDYRRWACADNGQACFDGTTLIQGISEHHLLCGQTRNNAIPFPNIADAFPMTGFATYHSTIAFRDMTVVNFPWAEPQFPSNYELTSGGGVRKTDDFYTEPVELGGLFNSNIRSINCHPGYLSPPPYIEGIVNIPNTNPLETRAWNLAVQWDPHGYWGPAGNYCWHDVLFFTSGAAGLVDITDGTNLNGKSTSTKYHGMRSWRDDVSDLVVDNKGGTLQRNALTVVRKDPATLAVIDTLVIPTGVNSRFYNGFRHFAAQNGGLFIVSHPGDANPQVYQSWNVTNGELATDVFTVGLPWNGSVPVRVCTGNTFTGTNGFASAADVTANRARILTQATGATNDAKILAVVNDANGDLFHQDTANNLVYLKWKGGFTASAGQQFRNILDKLYYRDNVMKIRPVE